jgi:predicted nucleic acid-binding protein
MAAALVIADSSIWIDHINKGDPNLSALLKRRRIAVHQMIIGEVALGSIANRERFIEEVKRLPQAKPASHAEVMAMIEWFELFNCGIGYVDAHLIAAARQLADGRLWTRDKKLHAQAARLGVAYSP